LCDLKVGKKSLASTKNVSRLFNKQTVNRMNQVPVYEPYMKERTFSISGCKFFMDNARKSLYSDALANLNKTGQTIFLADSWPVDWGVAVTLTPFSSVLWRIFRSKDIIKFGSLEPIYEFFIVCRIWTIYFLRPDFVREMNFMRHYEISTPTPKLQPTPNPVQPKKRNAWRNRITRAKRTNCLKHWTA
jgi:hypothetical protein